MYKKEIKNELYIIHKSIKNIDNELIDIKIAVHNLDKLGFNMDYMYDLIDNLGVELYKFKMKYNDLEKDMLKEE